MEVRRLRPIFIVLLLTLCSVAPSFAVQPRAVHEAIERFFAESEVSEDWFAPSFLALVPFEQIPLIRSQLTARLGAFEGVRADGDRWLAVFEKGLVPTLAELDSNGRFVGLRLLPPMARVQQFDELVTRFDDLPGAGSMLVVVEGEERLAHRADTPYAVGSAFKFVVLRALVRAIEAGRFSWNQVVELRSEHRTVQTGTLSRWPDGAPLTLYSVAAWMIAESDNTATDLLIQLLGREAVEAADPSGRNRPFLTTLEAFQLKDPRNLEQLERWRLSDETGRREVLESLSSAPIPAPGIFSEGPRATDVEWYFTARELCTLAAELSALDLMGINPGVVSGEHFRRVAYKGGSEPGVLNLTTWVTTTDGRDACVCATRNAEAEIDLNALVGLVGAAFELVREQ